MAALSSSAMFSIFVRFQPSASAEWFAMSWVFDSMTVSRMRSRFARSVDPTVGHVAGHLLGADQHAFNLGVVHAGEIRPRADVQVEAGAREELDRRVLERAFGDAEFEFHVSLLSVNTKDTKDTKENFN